jgi:hypothetical protein
MDIEDYNEIRNSWILFAIRDVLEKKDVRNMILEREFDDNDIYFGDSFVGEYDYDILNKYVDYCINKINKNLILFTISNSVKQCSDVEDCETHFQTVIIDKINKVIIFIDPSRKQKRSGIYSTKASNMLIKYMKNAYPSYKIKWNPVKTPCQTNNKDVFCQSWSLYLQILFVQQILSSDFNYTTLKAPIIPVKLSDRYDVLLQFYKNIFSKNKLLCKYLNEAYKSDIDNFSTDLSKLIKNRLLKEDVCLIFPDKFTAEDLM